LNGEILTKNSEETITGVDIHGRLEALDQSVRSVDGRLRAVERRLSYKSQGKGGEQGAKEEYDIHDEIEKLISHVATLAKSVDEIKNPVKVNVLTEIESKVESTKAELSSLVETNNNLKQKLEAFSDAKSRLDRLENMNKITIGKIKVPLELSGLIAAFVLLTTGFLILADKWNIIRSSYYPISIGILFGAVVIARFVMTNRETG
jgi:tetrahydromethanopterin S-methyltransferase subunit G